MENTLRKVRHKGEVVSEVNVPVYATFDELVNSEKQERIVSVFNNGNAVRIMGNERAKFSGTRTGKKKRLQMAFNCVSVEELMAVQGNADALNALLESEEVQARVDAKLQETGASVETAEETVAEDEANEE